MSAVTGGLVVAGCGAGDARMGVRTTKDCSWQMRTLWEGQEWGGRHWEQVGEESSGRGAGMGFPAPRGT